MLGIQKIKEQKKNENIFVSDCPCHILHDAASKANLIFSKRIKFDLEDHSVDLYYWHDKSKWEGALLKYFKFCDQE